MTYFIEKKYAMIRAEEIQFNRIFDITDEMMDSTCNWCDHGVRKEWVEPNLYGQSNIWKICDKCCGMGFKISLKDVGF